MYAGIAQRHTEKHRRQRPGSALLLAVLGLAMLIPATALAAQTCPAPTPVPPLGSCRPSACTPGFCSRGDIAPLASQPAIQPLQDRLVTLDCSPHSVAPVQVFAEADPVTRKSQLFMYYLLDSTGFQPSVFTTRIPGINDDPSTMLTVWGANCGLSTLGAVRVALEPKPGLPSDPDDPRAFIDIFTDIRGLFVINNESGWYEGWMIHDLRVVEVAVESRTDALVSAARTLQCSPVAVSLAAVVTYGRLLIAEREERVRQRIGEGERKPRTVQAIRGHVTRALLHQLQPIVNAMTGKTKRRTRR
jgi:hypothetical protein